MRSLDKSSTFKQDYKRQLKGRYAAVVTNDLKHVLNLLAFDVSLPPQFLDHPLNGQWRGFRECHLKPDLLLIYKKVGADTLKLARLGSHSQLFD